MATSSTIGDPNTSRHERSRWRRGAVALAVFIAAYLLIAYLLVPLSWSHYYHRHPALEDAPRITHTADGHPGDPLNVALVGSEADVKAIMQAAEWHPANALGLKSDLAIGVDTVLDRPDVDAPVSSLFLFGRKEDLAFECPVGDSPKKRNHVRFWKTDKPDEEGRPLWIGAATYDERVGLSHTTGEITHHTAPDVDEERDFMFADLKKTGDLSESYFVDNYHTVREGKNGGGDPWHTDGRLEVGVIKTLAAKTVTPVNAVQPTNESVRWLTNLDEAKHVAAAEGKDLFINFTGLSWCGPCMQLEYEVLKSHEFAPTAEHFVLVRLDYPSGVRRLQQEPAETPIPWRDYYGINGFPTVILADAAGKPYALTGNIGLKALPYREHIEKLRAAHAQRDRAFAQAAAAAGLEKARFLAVGLTTLRNAIDESYSASNTDPLVHFYREEIDEVTRLDAEGAAGLRGPIEKMLMDQEQRTSDKDFYALLSKTFQEQGANAALNIIDEKIKTAESIERRNLFRHLRRTHLEMAERYEEALALSRELAEDESLTPDERFASRRESAQNLRRLNRVDECLACYDQLIAEAHDNPRRVFGLLDDKADTLRELQRFTEALAEWEKAIGLAESGTEKWERAANWRINILARLGRADDAWAAWEQTAKMGWNRPLGRESMMVQIAYYLNENGSREAAMAAADRADKAVNEAEASSQFKAEEIAGIRKRIAAIKAAPPTKAATAARWLTNLDEAKKIAATEHKDLLIVFTGTSWCGPCKQLENEVLSRAEFAPTAEHFVLVKLDYPPGGVRRLPQEPADSSVTWSDYYCGGGLPGVFLTDTVGKPYATTGNLGLEAGAYREYIEKLRGVHGKRDEAFAKAAVASGIERAQYLADGLTTLRNAIEENYRDRNNDPFFRFYRAEIDEVLRLDADGAAGLRGPLDKMLAESNRDEINAFYALFDKTYTEQGIDAALKMLDDKLTATESAKLCNDLRLIRRNLLEQSERFEEAFAVTRELASDKSRTADERFTDRMRMAWNLWHLNRQEESLAIYDELFAASARYPWRLWALARDKADSFQYSGQFAEALSTWELVIPRLTPSSDLLNEALLSRIRLLARLGRADDAWAEFDRVSAAGWEEPSNRAGAMVLISEGLNEYGSHEAALAASARAEQALNAVAATNSIELNSLAYLRRKLEQVKAGPPAAATNSSDLPSSQGSKK